MPPLSNAAMYNQKKLVGKGDGRKKYIKKALKLSNELKKWSDQTTEGTVLEAQGKKLKHTARKNAGVAVTDEFGEPIIDTEVDSDRGVPIAGGFPRRYVTRDPYDDVIRVKQKLAKTVGNNRPIPVTEKEVSAILRKEQQAEEAKLEEFFMLQYADKIVPTDPANLRWAQEIMPSMYSERMKMIEEQAEIQKKIAALKLMGPKSEEDIRFLHGIQRGFVRVSPKPLYQLGGKELKEELKRGWWSPLNPSINLRRADVTVNQMANIPKTATTYFNDVDEGVTALTAAYS